LIVQITFHVQEDGLTKL